MTKSSGASWNRWLYAGAAVLLGLSLGMSRPAYGGAEAACVGDCNDDGEVAIDDIITMVNIANGLDDIESCLNGDADCNGEIAIDDIIVTVNNANTTPDMCQTVDCGGDAACGDGMVTPPEECDDGGVCTGGNMAGMDCDSEDECGGTAQPGVCLAGANLGGECMGTEDCPGSECRRCKTFGGDGCAANCTTESNITFNLIPGMLMGSDIQTGTSGAVVFGEIIPMLPLPLTGTQVLTVGKKRGNQITGIIKAASVQFPAIPVSTIACACVRGFNAKTCGGTLRNLDQSQTTICTDNETICPAAKPCSTVHGDGNSASGFVGCGGLEPANVSITQDCNGEPGGMPFPPRLALSGSGGPGSAIILNTIRIGTRVGSCTTPTAFCTDADPPETRGTPQTLPFTTGTATALVENANDFPEFDIGPQSKSGTVATCTEPSNPDAGTIVSVTNVCLSGAFTACDQPTIADIVVVNTQCGQ